MPQPPNVVILAAGQGTRMRSALPKVLHPLCGVPLILWPVRAALAAGAGRVIVVGGPDGALEQHLPDGIELAVQAEPRGTGDAVRAGVATLDPRDPAPLLIVPGDVPLLTPAVLRALAETHEACGAAATIATMELDDPSGYGRIVRGPQGEVERVVETKVPGDATAEQLALREVNSGLFAFAVGPLQDALGVLSGDNAQGEQYLPDVLPALRSAGHRIAAHALEEPAAALGINDRVDLSRVQEIARRRLVEDHMRAGVTFVDASSTVVEVDVAIGPDTVVEPGSYLRGSTSIGRGCRIGPGATLADTRVGDGAEVLQTHAERAEIEPGARVGPFAYLRPGAQVGAGAKVGTFVEIKNSVVGAGAKVPHLSYIGDADIGERTNLGAGTITANYDGRAKHRTRVGRDVHGGVDTALVAPVSVGDGAWTAAGSVITQDIPPGALGVARARQRNVDGYDDRQRSG